MLSDRAKEILESCKQYYKSEKEIKRTLRYRGLTEEENEEITRQLIIFSKNLKELYDKININKEVEKYKTKCIKLDLSNEETNVFNSKIGGVPYLPLGYEYPKSKIDNEPLMFFAQINFEEVPHLENFPEKGILQFYLKNEDMIGLNFEYNYTDDILVLYHKDIITDEDLLYKDIDNFKNTEYGEVKNFKLNPKIEYSYPNSSCNYEFFHKFNEIIDTYFEENDVIDLEPEHIKDLLTEYYENNSCQIGGYPYYINDPITEDENQILLFQLIDNDTIHCVDLGWYVTNFFIHKDDLINLDFSKILYHGDCT